jgi:hypothetical protein
MRVARAYETDIRGADVQDVSRGDRNAIQVVLAERGVEAIGALSADLVSRGTGEPRVIEVKHRALWGPVHVRERQMDTFRFAGALAWLYVVLNATQPYPVELWGIPDPIRLPWAMNAPASRERGQPRGVRHEAEFEVDPAELQAVGEPLSLDGLELPRWVGTSRD